MANTSSILAKQTRPYCRALAYLYQNFVADDAMTVTSTSLAKQPAVEMIAHCFEVPEMRVACDVFNHHELQTKPFRG